MQAIVTPFSQLRPGPSPRTNRALPKPTSILAVMAVTTGLDVTGFTLRFGEAVSVITGAATTATFFFAAGLAGVLVLVAGAGDLVALLMVFLIALMVTIGGWITPYSKPTL